MKNIEGIILTMKDDVVIIIPSYNPDSKLVEIVDELIKNNYSNIVLVNDGSYKNDIFNMLSNRVIVITHSTNLGKGSALKTGFTYCLDNFKNINGVITIDDDGQHKVNDINKVYYNIIKNGIVLGSRDFNQKGVPFKSKLGNLIMSRFISCAYRINIQDSQTGLRFISYELLSTLTNINGSGFEYEMNTLLYCMKNKVTIEQVKIETVYFQNNAASHFKPVSDSFKILLNTINTIFSIRKNL